MLLVEKMAANAPRDIKNDAETFLDAMRKLEAGDSSVKNSAAVKKAVNNVNRHYARAAGCTRGKARCNSSAVLPAQKSEPARWAGTTRAAHEVQPFER